MKRLLSVIFLMFCIFIFCSCENAQTTPDTNLSIVVKEFNEEAPEFSFGNGEDAYEMGFNKDDYPIFKDTSKAFEQLCKDYADEFKLLEEEFDLDPISKSNWLAYGNLGWQSEILPGNTGQEISSFFDFYENCFTSEQRFHMIR